MQVNRVSNQNDVNFGIKYVNQPKWNKEILNAFQNSKLVKDIDKKYPKATASYDKFFDWEDETYTVVSQINLKKDKNFRWTLSSHSESFPDNQFVKFLKSANLQKVEDESVETLKPMVEISINAKKVSLIDRLKEKFNYFGREHME